MSKVWFYNIFGSDGWAADDTMFYGIVNDEKTLITVPLGQEAEYLRASTGKHPLLLGFLDDDTTDSGNLTIAIKDGGNKLEFLDYGPCLYLPEEGYVNVLFGDIICTK